MTASPSDETLHARIRRGDLAAFDELYARYERRLFGFLVRMVRDRGEAEDLLHDAFVGVLESREVDFSTGSFAAWLYRVARNLCLNRLRARGRADSAKARLPAPEAVESAEDRVAAGQLAGALAEAVARLSPALSDVYHLRTAGLSYEEMAAALEIPVGTIKSRMNQLVRELQREVRPWTTPNET